MARQRRRPPHRSSRQKLVDVEKLARLADVLRTQKVALVLDNFETNLVVGGGDFLDPIVFASLRSLCEAAQVGKLLVTCRHPLPGLQAWLLDVPVGPLSPAESRRLLLRLPGLKNRAPEEIAGVLRRIGGHPRMLEYVDALVRGGRAARLPQLGALLEQQATLAGVSLGDSLDRLDEATREALLVGAQDVLLGELLELADEAGAGEVLRQAAVSSLPLTFEGLAHCLLRPRADRDGSLRGPPVGPGADTAVAARAGRRRPGVGPPLDRGEPWRRQTRSRAARALPASRAIPDLALRKRNPESRRRDGGRREPPCW